MEYGKNRFFNICEAYQCMLGKMDSIGEGAKKYRKTVLNESVDDTAYSPYIDIPKFRDEVEKALVRRIDYWDIDDSKKEMLRNDRVGVYLDEVIIPDTVKSFDKYVHRDDTSLFGNFADIRLDYEHDHEGTKFSDIIEKIDSGVKDAETEEFKDWAIEWYFKAFGTYNLGYNFGSFVEDDIYDDDVEEK